MNLNIISWNVRGLGRSTKKALVKNFIELHRVDVCCFQEKKLSIISQPSWRDIGVSKLDQFCFLRANGTSGGMVIGENNNHRNGKVVSVGIFCLTVEFTNSLDQSIWLCTTVYGLNLCQL